MAKVAFDGINKLIIVTETPGTSGVVEIDAQIDLYSDWKEWVISNTNVKYLEAIQTVAGDPISADQYISPYFFLVNGWRIRPYESTHQLVINGNLFVEGGVENPFVPTLGAYNVMVRLNTTVNAVTTVVSVSGGGGGEPWDQLYAQHQIPGSFGELVTNMSNDVSDLNQAQIIATGSVQAGSTATKVNTSLTRADNFYNGNKLVVLSVAHGTNIRKIDQYTNASGACYLSDALPFIPNTLDIIFVIADHESRYGST